MSAPTPAANAPASTGFLSGIFGAKKPANASAPATPVAAATGGRRRGSRKSRSRKDRKDRSRKNRKDRSRKDRSRSRKNRNRK